MNDLINFVDLYRPEAPDWDGETPYRVAEVKLDGWRITVIRGNGNDVRIYGRRKSANLWRDILPHKELRESFRALPERTIVDGELWVAGADMRSSQVSMYLRKPAENRMRFSAFAVPMHSGADTRPLPLLALPTTIRDLGLFPVTRIVTDGSMDPAYLNARIKQLGVEGFVLKLEHWRNWYRVKPYKTADLQVIGIKQGKGRHIGRVGSLQVAALNNGQLVEVGYASGMTDQERDDITEQGRAVLGRIIECRYDSVGAEGGLRFPRFVCFRDDKETPNHLEELWAN